MKKVKENPALSYMTWNFYLISEIVNKILILERRLYPFTYKIIVYLQVIYQKKKKNIPRTNRWIYQSHRIQAHIFKNHCISVY